MTKSLIVEMLPASEGDCILVGWGTDTTRRWMLIDGGRAATWKHLKPRLAELRAQGVDVLDLLVVTHVDRDHIEGVLTMFEDPDRPRFRDAWFNGFVHLRDLQTFGAKQGEALSDLLSKGIWNAATHGASICSDDTDTLELEGGLKLHLLSPSRAKLLAMIPVWEAECKKAGILPGQVEPDVESELESFGGFDVEALADAPFKRDRAEANGTSIAFLVEYENALILFGADAHPDQLQAALDDWTDPDTGRVQLMRVRIAPR